jgi:AraC-like DNA-binding protein
VALQVGGLKPHPYQYDLIWYAVAGCRTIANALGLIELFSNVLEGRMPPVTSLVKGDRTCLMFLRKHEVRTPVTFMADVLRLISFDHMLSWLHGERIDSVAFDLDYPKGFAVWLPEELLTRPVNFQQPLMALDLPASIEKRAIGRTPAELENLLPISPVLLSDRAGGAYAARIARCIDEAIADDRPIPGLSEVAQREFCSVATLRRRLADDRTSFQAIKNERRYAWAMRLLQRRRHSTAEIADKLDFADETAFRRAFKQWTGMSPGAYRP